MLVTFIPLTDTLVVFHELINPPRLLACQQKVPAPSKVKGIVIVDVTGLQAPPTVGVTVVVGPVVGVKVRVGVLVITGGVVGVKVRVGVLVIPEVGVRVGEAPTVGVLVITDVALGVKVRVGVFEGPAVDVEVTVEVGTGVPPPGCRPQASAPFT
jgi:hypothetical protein